MEEGTPAMKPDEEPGGGISDRQAVGARIPSRIVVAVHGIGDQTAFETIQVVVNRALEQFDRPAGVPLGKLHSRLAAGQPWASFDALPGLGFAEVFWADIGRDNENYVLEDAVPWAETVAERLRVIDRQVLGDEPVDEIDVEAVRRTLSDLSRAIGLSRILNAGLARVGVGSMDLDRVLVRFLGDVQLFADYDGPRDRILDRFDRVMEGIRGAVSSAGEDASHPEIHICAHSLGSVVAFLALLRGRQRHAAWLPWVRSLMTIGSPIDKFLVLWPELWSEFLGGGEEGSRRPLLHRPIRWLNYADRADPVGFELDLARNYLRRLDSPLFIDGAPDDRVFSRYFVPGKAHVEYWRDQALFAEWFGDCLKVGKPSATPGDRRLRRAVALILLFLVPVAFDLLAAHGFATVFDQIGGPPVLIRTLGSPSTDSVLRQGFLPVAAMAAVLFGTTALGVFGRVSRRGHWLLLGAAVHLIGFLLLLPVFTSLSSRIAIGAVGLAALLPGIFVHGANARFRRPILIAAVVAASLAAFAVATFRMHPTSISTPLAWLGVALVSFMLGVLFLDLAVVWVEYVSRPGDRRWLERRWGIKDPGAAAPTSGSAVADETPGKSLAGPEARRRAEATPGRSKRKVWW